MTFDLAALLVQDGVVTAEQAARAAARQRAAGGALDTALLELGLVEEPALVAALSRVSGLPAAPPSAWNAADARARRVFPSRVAERHGLAPFALSGRELSLVTSLPLDGVLLDEISFMLSLHLTPHVAPEWRVRTLIHQLYGGPHDPRFAALAEGGGKLATPLVVEVPYSEAPAAAPVGPQAPEPASDADQAASFESAEEPLLEEPDGLDLQPEPRPQPSGFSRAPDEPLDSLAEALAQALESDELLFLEEPLLEEPPGEGLPAMLAGTGAEAAVPVATPGTPPGWTLEEARAALAAASTRDAVVHVVLRYARDLFEFAGFFAVTRDAVVGHDALGVEEDARERCRGTAIYVSDPGTIHTVIETRAPYLGPVDRAAAGNQAVLDGLGRGTPRTVLAAPVLLRDRVACVLYADNGPAPVSPRRLQDLLVLVSAVGPAFDRLIRERKKRGAAAGLTQEPWAATPLAEVAEGLAAEESPPEAAEAEPVPEPPVRTGPAAAPPLAPSPSKDEPAAARVAESRVRAPAPAAQPLARPERDAAPGGKASSGRAAAPSAPPEPWRTSEPALEVPDFDIDLELDPATAEVEADALAPRSPLDAALAALLASAAGTTARAAAVEAVAKQAGAVQALCALLPGPIEGEAGPEPAAYGPVPAALAALGTAAVPSLLPLLQEADGARRRLAAVLLGQAADPSAFPALADRALDADPRVAAAAAEALARSRRHPAMRTVPEKLRRALLSGVAARAAGAAQALGALRDAEAIPMLIQVVEAADRTSAGAAAEALGRITLQRIGPDARAWLGWWKENRGRGRAEWLFSGLTHPEASVREAAAAELSAAAPPPVRYAANAPAAERESAARAWAGWWARSGQVL